MLLAKIAGIVTLVWFYQSAQKRGLPPIQWALIGLIGFWVSWWIVTLGVANPLLEAMEKSSAWLLLLIRQLPALAGVATAVLVQKRFLMTAPVPDAEQETDE
ncbi:MAG: hypothetical protein RQ715_06825 [Methylococcales bacterium]|nr:hypothetical protein [Methylococcales bacterium]